MEITKEKLDLWNEVKEEIGDDKEIYLLRFEENMEDVEGIEYVNLRLRIPKAVVDFLRTNENHMKVSAEEYLEYSIVSVFTADLEANEGSRLFEDNYLAEAERLGLDEITAKILGCSYFIP